MKLLRMAWRNLWRNGRRTLVTVGAMTLALWAMVLYTSLMQGMLGSMESTLLDVELGEIQIHADGYRERPSIWSASKIRRLCSPRWTRPDCARARACSEAPWSLRGRPRPGPCSRG